MASYTLQPHEAPILISDAVHHGEGMLRNHTDELVLTNLNLIWIEKGVLGRVKQVEYIPLSLVKVIDDRAQAMKTKHRNGAAQLEVFLQDGQRVFTFQTHGAAEVTKWIRAINRAVTGNDLPPEPPGKAATVAAVAESMLGALRNRSAGRRTTPPPPPPWSRPAPVVPPTVSSTCPGCGASASGPRGTTSRCRYCDSDVTLS